MPRKITYQGLRLLFPNISNITKIPYTLISSQLYYIHSLRAKSLLFYRSIVSSTFLPFQSVSQFYLRSGQLHKPLQVITLSRIAADKTRDIRSDTVSVHNSINADLQITSMHLTDYVYTELVVWLLALNDTVLLHASSSFMQSLHHFSGLPIFLCPSKCIHEMALLIINLGFCALLIQNRLYININTYRCVRRKLAFQVSYNYKRTTNLIFVFAATYNLIRCIAISSDAAEDVIVLFQKGYQ